MVTFAMFYSPPLLEIGAHPDFVLILIEHTTDWGHLVLRKAEDG